MNALIFGRRRQGKSTLSLTVAVNQYPRVIIFDPNCQFQCFPVTQDPADVEEWAEANVDNGAVSVVVYRPNVDTLHEDFEALTDALWQYEQFAFIVDETSVLQSPSWIHLSLDRLIRQGRDIAIIQSTHRCVDTNRICRGLITDGFFFQTEGQPDLAMIANDFMPALSEQLRGLGKHEVAHYWITEDGGLHHFNIWSNPAEWHVRIE